jgi:hypothetical protein
MGIEIKRHQTLADFVTQQSGDLQEWVNMCMQNGISVTDEIPPGTNISVAVTNRKTRNYFIRKGREISTMPGKELLPGGIDYMQIGNDFRIR